MKKTKIVTLLVITAVILSGFSFATLVRADDSDKTPTSVIAKQLPDKVLEDLDGNKYNLKDFKGKKVFMNFWATWCGYCRREMPDMEKIYQANKDDKDFVMIAVNVGEDKEKVKAFIQKNKFNFLVLTDTDESVTKLFNVEGYPTSYFFNKDGSTTKVNLDGQISDCFVGMMTYEEMVTNVKNIQ